MVTCSGIMKVATSNTIKRPLQGNSNRAKPYPAMAPIRVWATAQTLEMSRE